MRIAIVVTVLLVLAGTGCGHDERIKRAASVNNVKTKTAKAEFEAATTPEKKLDIAQEYFRNATEFSQVFEDYVFSRKPAPKPEIVGRP